MVGVLLLGVGVLVAIGLGWIILSYNAFVTLRNQIQNSWSQIDVQLKRRYDLVPNLVETVKGYAKHEKDTFTDVVKARNMVAKAGNFKEKAQAENMLTGALKSIFALSEDYPKLQANQNFLMLQEELAGIESKVAFARQFYNDSVLRFNNKVQTFPDSIIAGSFGFAPKDYFEVSETERRNVKVQF